MPAVDAYREDTYQQITIPTPWKQSGNEFARFIYTWRVFGEFRNGGSEPDEIIYDLTATTEICPRGIDGLPDLGKRVERQAGRVHLYRSQGTHAVVGEFIIRLLEMFIPR